MRRDVFDAVVAGQSNAAGTGVGPAEENYIKTPNIMMLTDEGNPRFAGDCSKLLQ